MRLTVCSVAIMPLLTLPLELRKKIYAYALELAEEVLVCECPEHLRSKRGFCDQSKTLANIRFLWKKEARRCAAVRELMNPKISLTLLCKQVADEVNDMSICMRLPVLAFYSQMCCFRMMHQLEKDLRFDIHFRRTQTRAVKIVECVSISDDAFAGIPRLPTSLIHLHDFEKRTSLTMVSSTDSGWHPPITRGVETCYTNDEWCLRLQRKFDQIRLSK